MRTKSQNNRPLGFWGSVVSTLLIGMLTGGASCNDNDDKCELAPSCDAGYVVYTCKVPLLGWQESCQPVAEAAREWCNGLGGTQYVEVSCGLYQSETGETGETGQGAEPWDPSSHVTYNSSTQEYEVNESFADSLIADYQQLGQDSAYLTQVTTGSYAGYYQLAGVTSGDLAYAMGLQSGDIVISVNGYDLNTFDEQVTAFTELVDEDEFELTILRSTSTITLDYVIVPPTF